MIQMMLSGIGNEMRAQPMALRHVGLVRKMVGLAIVGSGFAVIFAHGLHHVAGF
ncbi:hypothetical protein [Paraburkholderia phosphatilytica]|uniref:hypothetical protein n=1 Tax=Paraburkholderia phosphatilytica TaxID=2282883 RepID=UPI0013E08AB0|nr:hypothetical protein [Paraburkholderia phosphatilytica]